MRRCRICGSYTVGYLFISIQPLGRFHRNQSSVRWPVWLWQTASWANFLGVCCHYFPLLLDFPTFAASCLHVRNDARDPNNQMWNWARMSGNFAEMTTSTSFTCRKSTTWDRRLYFPFEGRRLRPGLNTRTWVLKASTLPLDHRSWYCRVYGPFICQLPFLHGSICICHLKDRRCSNRNSSSKQM